VRRRENAPDEAIRLTSARFCRNETDNPVEDNCRSPRGITAIRNEHRVLRRQPSAIGSESRMLMPHIHRSVGAFARLPSRPDTGHMQDAFIKVGTDTRKKAHPGGTATN